MMRGTLLWLVGGANLLFASPTWAADPPAFETLFRQRISADDRAWLKQATQRQLDGCRVLSDDGVMDVHARWRGKLPCALAGPRFRLHCALCRRPVPPPAAIKARFANPPRGQCARRLHAHRPVLDACGRGTVRVPNKARWPIMPWQQPGCSWPRWPSTIGYSVRTPTTFAKLNQRGYAADLIILAGPRTDWSSIRRPMPTVPLRIHRHRGQDRTPAVLLRVGTTTGPSREHQRACCARRVAASLPSNCAVNRPSRSASTSGCCGTTRLECSGPRIAIAGKSTSGAVRVAVELGCTTDQQADRIATYLATHSTTGIVQRGQVRHLPAGETWQRLLHAHHRPGTSSRLSGARPFPGSPGHWCDAAIRCLAVRLVGDVIPGLPATRNHGVCVNADYHAVPEYVVSATNVYALVK